MHQVGNRASIVKGSITSLNTRRQRLLCSLLIIICLFTNSQILFAKNIKLPDNLSGKIDSDLCLIMMDILIDKYDLSVEGAAAVMGNIAQESTFDPNVTSPEGYHGIFQWDASRWEQIVSYLHNNGGRDETNAVEQLDAAFSGAEGERFSLILQDIKKTTSIEDGVWQWLNRYEEAPGQNEAERVNYAYMAKELYELNQKAAQNELQSETDVK